MGGNDVERKDSSEDDTDDSKDFHSAHSISESNLLEQLAISLEAQSTRCLLQSCASFLEVGLEDCY